MSALWVVQVAIAQALEAYAPLVAAGWSVFDEPPENHPGPYIVVGEGTEEKRRAFKRPGWNGTETLHLWAQGGSSEVVRQGAALVVAALEAPGALNVEGFAVAGCKYEFGTTLKEDGDAPGDDPWRHVPLRFRIWTRAAAS